MKSLDLIKVPIEYKEGDIVQFTREAVENLKVSGRAEIIGKGKYNNTYHLKGFNNSFHTDWFTLVNLEDSEKGKEKLIPKGIKYDSDKLRYSLIPWTALKEVVKVLEFGAKKYAVDNWKQIDPQRYKDAAMRHLVAILEGDWLDKESQLPHAAHCVCCLLFLLWFKLKE